MSRLLSLLDRLLDGAIALLAYWAGRRDAETASLRKAVKDAKSAKSIADKLAADPAYRSRVRDKFKRG